MAKAQRKHSFEQERHHQLEVLYKISKAIASFETVKKTFPALLSMAAEALPLQSSILMESGGGEVATAIWQAEGVSREKVSEARKLASLFYAQLAGPPSLRAMPEIERVNCIALPLGVYHRPTFGVLLLQGLARMDEENLAFADALTNLIAVAVDRYYTANDVLELREKYIMDLEAERGLRESFVSILTHDLRNPLGAAKLSAGLILDKSVNPDVCQKMARQITSSIDRVDHMIENLLDANRIRAGERLPLEIEEFDLRCMLKSTLDELSIVHGDRIFLTEFQEVRGYWSRDGIRRAIENLISNAVKYGYPDRPITVSLKQTPQTVIIAVHNEGSPIPPEELANLFQQFRRTKSAHASGIRGWGLGLTLVRGVVEAHGGTVKVESAPGTTFTLELPRDARPFYEKDDR